MKRMTFLFIPGLIVCVALSPVAVAQKAEKPQKPAHETPFAANEAIAVGSTRSINTAQVYYAKTYADLGFSCELSAFGPPKAGEKPSAKASDLLDASLTSGKKSGYQFILTCPDKSQPQKKYRIAAVPISPGEAGKHAICSDESAVIKTAEDGKASTCFASGKVL